MRSPDRAGRRTLEHALRAVAVLLLALAIGIAVRALRERPSGHASGLMALREALVRWSTEESPGEVHVALDSIPEAEARDWLAALRQTGTATSWHGDGLAAAAATVEPIADPKLPVRISVAAPADAPVVVRDSAGLIDTLRIGAGGGGRIVAASVAGVLRVGASTAAPTAALRDSLVLRPMLVLGAAGWEGKFVVASLEEYGWKVDARLVLAPRQVVVQGPTTPAIDTARYAAVVALDSLAGRSASAIARYVRSGGGLVVLAAAAGTPALRPLLPARPDAALLDEGTFEGDTLPPREALALVPLGRLAAGGRVLERRGDRAAVAIRRVGAGRVIQIGYRDMWRWRMAARGDSTLDAYRRWWSGAVSAVAYAPRLDLPGAGDAVAAADPAPLASLVATLGPPTRPRANQADDPLDPRLFPILFILVVVSLLLEWASRRLRGAQ